MAKEKGEKAKKDPNAPKRALTAYLLFSNDHREQLKKDEPNLSFGEVGKKLGQMWKDADEKTKKKYEAAHEKDKKRYEEEMAAYKPGEGAPAKKAAKEKKEKPAKAAPKKGKKKEEEEDEEEEEEDE